MKSGLAEKRIPTGPAGYDGSGDWWWDKQGGRILLCRATLRRYFDLPRGLSQLTIVLSNRYSAGTCYELVLDRDSILRVLVDGEPTTDHFISLGEELAIQFLRKHGNCYGSVEYEE